MDLPKKGRYRHYKGGSYELIDIATHSETLEKMAVYRALYGESELWVRPLSMWRETVERDGRRCPRFMTEEEYARFIDDGAAQVAPPPEEVPPVVMDNWPGEEVPPEAIDDWPPEAMDNWPPEEVPPEVMDDWPPATPRSEGKTPITIDDFLASENAPAPAAVMNEVSTEDKMALLQRVYGYASFREGQEEVIDSILSGRDTLAVMPTGAGKSICYQLPAQLLDGVALVVSPLISLMQDQVNALTQSGVAAAYLNSSLTERQFTRALDKMRAGEYKIVYVAPERLLTPRFLEVTQQLRISLLAVDEAHCISQWGQDFRPSYLQIPDFIRRLPRRPEICAFTATATERVRRDISRLLDLKTPYEKVTGFNRPNLYMSVIHAQDKDAELARLMADYRGFSGIVYCATRKNVERVCTALQKQGYAATRYHAGLSDAERKRNQEDFIYDRQPIMVATNAFGMGIDKSNVRFVIHYNMPKDLESYYQEAGRAGRDGERSDCHLLFDNKDIVLQRFFIDHMGEEGDLDPQALREVQKNALVRLNAMIDYARSPRCLRRTLLKYFAEDSVENCGYCSNCLDPRPMEDVTGAAKLVLACVREVGGRFGLRTVAEILHGSASEKLRERGLTRRKNYGALKGLSLNNVIGIINALVDAGALQISEGDYPLLQIAENAAAVDADEMPVMATLEAAKKSKSKRKKTSANRGGLSQNVDTQLFDALRALRMDISRQRSIPPYAVFNDATLMEMCRVRPQSLEELRSVKGVGDYKLKAFGAAFVIEIAKYKNG